MELVFEDDAFGLGLHHSPAKRNAAVALDRSHWIGCVRDTQRCQCLIGRFRIVHPGGDCVDHRLVELVGGLMVIGDLSEEGGDLFLQSRR